MPLFEYRCNSCNDTREYLLSSANEKPYSCNSCGQKTLERVWDGQTFGFRSVGDANVYIEEEPSSRRNSKSLHIEGLTTISICPEHGIGLVAKNFTIKED